MLYYGRILITPGEFTGRATILAPFDGNNVLLDCNRALFDRVELAIDLTDTTTSVWLASGGLLQTRRMLFDNQQDDRPDTLGLTEPVPQLDFAYDTRAGIWVAAQQDLVIDPRGIRQLGSRAYSSASNQLSSERLHVLLEQQTHTN